MVDSLNGNFHEELFCIFNMEVILTSNYIFKNDTWQTV